MTDEQRPGLIERRPVHKGRIVDLSIDKVRFPNGKTGELELIRHSGASAVLPVLSELDADDPQILLIKQYRYAAAESVASRHVPRAISFVLLGSIGGALLGPELVTRGHAWLASVPYGGTLLVLAALYAIQVLLLLNLRGRRDEAGRTPAAPARPLRAIVTQPVFLVAVLGGTTGYGLMTLLMTATPLSMHVNDGFSLADTAAVIRMHSTPAGKLVRADGSTSGETGYGRRDRRGDGANARVAGDFCVQLDFKSKL